MGTNGLPDFKILTSGSWTAVYMNGEILAEGHVISAMDIFDALGIPYEYRVAPLNFFDKEHSKIDKNIERFPTLETLEY